MDISERLAALRAKKALENNNEPIIETPKRTETVESVAPSVAVDNDTVTTVVSNPEVSVPVVIPPVIKEGGAGASRTTNINHLDFLTKIQSLEQAIHTVHPSMPVLLMQIHKIIRDDPETVTILSEEEIGIIVNGLKVQTKTELVGTVLKQSKAKDKKTKLTVDML